MGHGMLKSAQTGKEELHYFPEKTSGLPPHLSPRIDLGRTPPSAVTRATRVAAANTIEYLKESVDGCIIGRMMGPLI